MNGSFNIDNKGRFEGLSSEALSSLVLEKEYVIKILKNELLQVKKLIKNGTSTPESLWLDEKLNELVNDKFGTKSEKEAPISPESMGIVAADTKNTSGPSDSEGPKDPTPKEGRVKLPSLKYPNLPVRVIEVTLGDSTKCDCCGGVLIDTGLTEDSERLSRDPAKYFVELQKRHKYVCKSKCEDRPTEGLLTAPNPLRVLPGSLLSDALVVNAALDKYCDLIPLTRQIKIAERLGVNGLNSGTLNTNIQRLAEFVEPVIALIVDEVFSSKNLRADETTHKMLEGSENKNWYLWSFSSEIAAFFIAKGTRSGDVATEYLLNSNCINLMRDVYTGYGKSVREVNQIRALKGQPLIQCFYCNAHARRYFKKAKVLGNQDAIYFIAMYQQIYTLDAATKIKGKTREQILELRSRMRPYFEKMQEKAVNLKDQYSAKSKMQNAINYFLNHYQGFIRFLEVPEMPIDNNSQEQILRNPVVGRKTWYGTHSELGAKTMGIFFTIIETCKLNHVNPREYFDALIQSMLKGESGFTPHEYLQMIQKP